MSHTMMERLTRIQVLLHVSEFYGILVLVKLADPARPWAKANRLRHTHLQRTSSSCFAWSAKPCRVLSHAAGSAGGRSPRHADPQRGRAWLRLLPELGGAAARGPHRDGAAGQAPGPDTGRGKSCESSGLALFTRCPCGANFNRFFFGGGSPYPK